MEMMLSEMPAGTDEIRRFLRVDRREIAYFRFILEAYEGLAVLHTLDPARGRVVLYASRSREAELEAFLTGLAGELLIEPAAGTDFAGAEIEP
jgi:hypothetical protein